MASEFEGLRKQAKRWLRSIQAGDRAARERLRAQLPQHEDPPRLREVQQALARERGFASWAVLKEALAGAEEGDLAALTDTFLECACTFTAPTDFPSKWQRAERIRARHPEIARSSIHAAVLCGEVEEVRRRIAAEPDALTRPGGPQQWNALLFACFGRLPNAQARERGLEIALLLLDAGADPRSCFISDDDWRLRFNALTGVMGQGEMGVPEHPHADALARALLDRGADPNDSQGLYNTHLVGDETRWLERLFAHGLDAEAPVSWHADPADAHQSGTDGGTRILDVLLTGAAKNGHVRRLALLLERGADPDARSIYDGNSAHQLARIHGNAEMVSLLLRHGATPEEPAGHDAFVAAVRSGDLETARRLLAAEPEWKDRGDPLTDAALRGEREIVERLLALGVRADAESQHGHRALHQACEDEALARLLLERGADPRGRVYGGSASDWARNAGNLPMARFHAEQSRSLVDAAATGHVELARQILAEDAAAIDERGPGGSPLHHLTVDPELAEPLIVLLLEHGADPMVTNDAGKTPAEALEERGADEVADLVSVHSGTGDP